MSMDWLKNFPETRVDLQWGPSIPQALEAVACTERLRRCGAYHTTTLRGLPSTSLRAVAERAEKAGGTLIVRDATEPVDAPLRDVAFVFAWNDAVVRIAQGREEAEVVISSGRPEEIERLADELRPALDRGANSWVHILRGDGKGGLSSTPAVRLTEPLQRDNYDSASLDDFDHVVSEFANSSPCGRFVLLDGQPGTGKTHLVRGLATAAQRAVFLIVPSTLAGQMGRPDVVDVLLGLRKSSREGAPIVVVVEDADSCLVPRQADNANAMAEILNATDGILGEALNLRVVATTNAKHCEIDPALLRSGRTCRRIELHPLRPDHACRVFERLTGVPRVFDAPVPLADIYAAARGSRSAAVSVDEGVGFRTSQRRLAAAR
jgi:hypothetical protein